MSWRSRLTGVLIGAGATTGIPVPSAAATPARVAAPAPNPAAEAQAVTLITAADRTGDPVRQTVVRAYGRS